MGTSDLVDLYAQGHKFIHIYHTIKAHTLQLSCNNFMTMVMVILISQLIVKIREGL